MRNDCAAADLMIDWSAYISRKGCAFGFKMFAVTDITALNHITNMLAIIGWNIQSNHILTLVSSNLGII